ncbi:hypothetical protein ACIBG7_26825 [Nonomuraea sp. NPDC050328]|uniref:hypothetical protein n=1 Tax=Nonomuraea sp. NPDC050328 TaxID=3364361 RepID=UPI0037B66FD0
MNVTLAERAMAQFHELPAAVQAVFVERIVDFLERPWDAAYAPHHGAEYRHLFFGEAGMATVRVQEAEKSLTVVDILWAG